MVTEPAAVVEPLLAFGLNGRQMLRSDADLLGMSESSYEGMSDDDLLRIVALAREDESGKFAPKGKTAWSLLAERHFDRVKGVVATFRHPKRPDVRIPRDERNDATQDAFIRLLRMLDNFKGSELPEYMAALRTCVIYACLDYCEQVMKREMGIGGSLDETLGEEENAAGRFDRRMAELAGRFQEAREKARDELGQLGEAIDKLSDDKRQCLRLTWEGFEPEEIASRLGTSLDNVYQLRSRGLKELRRLLDDD